MDKVTAEAGSKRTLAFGSWWLLAVLSFFYFLAFFDSYILLAVTIPSVINVSISQAILTLNEVRGQFMAVAYMLGAMLGFAVGPASVGALTNFLFVDTSTIG